MLSVAFGVFLVVVAVMVGGCWHFFVLHSFQPIFVWEMQLIDYFKFQMHLLHPLVLVDSVAFVDVQS